VQESLTNAIVHAPRARTTVELHGDDKELTIVVTNDVTTAAASSLAAEHAGTGVDNMRQRAELLGGSLHAGPHGRHWVVTSLLPLNRSAT
jgi:signal transduction histidine kinase